MLSSLNFLLLRPLATAKRAAILKKKAKSNSHWSVTITSETANLDESECMKITSHLEICTNYLYVNAYILLASYGLTRKRFCTLKLRVFRFYPLWIAYVSLFLTAAWNVAHVCCPKGGKYGFNMAVRLYYYYYLKLFKNGSPSAVSWFSMGRL